MRYFFLLATLALSLFLGACGGGGGSPGAVGGGPIGGGTTPTLASPTLSINIVNSNNAQVSSVGIGGNFTAKATLRDASGAIVTNRLVTFTLNGASIAVLMPESALTDATGIAQVNISPSSVTTVGAATIVATAIVGTSTVSGQFDFAVSASNLSLSPISVGSANLASGGNTSLQVNASIGNAPATGTTVNINFSTSCGRINGTGNSVGVTTNGSGVASGVYTAVSTDGSLCSGPVTISASSAGAAPRTTVINIAVPVANAITFASALPAQIFVSGSGALEQALVKFKVFSGSTPLANVAVKFTLLVNPGGVGLSASGSTAEVQGTTNALGEATVSVFSGTIPGPVRVRATLLSDSSVFAETQNLSVSSGPPSQRFMSLAVQTFNIEGWNVDGTATKLTVRLADRQGNPVEDGTVVNFTAEGGQVASSCPTLKSNGISSCSVDFISQNPRSAGGRASILAFTSGTKDYADVNGNNKYDAGIDTLLNIGDAYRDDNENALFDVSEFVVPRGGAQTCDSAGAPFPTRSNSCDSNLATTVRQQAVIMFSSSTPSLSLVSLSTATATVTKGTATTQVTVVTDVLFSLGSIDNVLLPMPSGTTFSVEAAGGTCTVDKVIGSSVVNIAPTTNPQSNLRTGHGVFLKDCEFGNTLLVKVKSPGGLETTIPVRLAPP